MTTPDTPVERQDAPSTTEETAIDRESPSLDLIKRKLLAITTEAELETVLEALNDLQVAKRRLREYEDQFEEATIFWLKSRGETSFDFGPTRYYIGDQKTTKARSNRDVLEALLTATRGDVDQIAAHLGAGAWRYGMARVTLGEDRFQVLFETKERETLKEGKPGKKLLSVPKRYLP